MATQNGFDFTSRMRLVCQEVVQSLPEFGHVDMNRVAVSFAQARMRTSWGMYASLTPLRFPGGNIEGQKRGRRYAIQQMVDRSGREMLYILTFYLPRFQDQTFREKLITIFHELWHISPHFDGDLRRHEGRCYAHTHSQAQYDAHMAMLVDRWLQLSPSPELLDFLEHSFHALQNLHGRVYGVKVPRPKLIPRAAS
jgi:Putative phage metallopeptidase